MKLTQLCLLPAVYRLLEPAFCQRGAIHAHRSCIPGSASRMSSTPATEERPAKQARVEYTHTREAFVQAYNSLREQLLNDEILSDQPAAVIDWMREMLDHNVPGGKLNRGMGVYDVLTSLKAPETLSETDIFKANSLGWCIEWLQAFFLVADDIMDGSITRRGQPCWYKVEKVGMIACNDYILLEAHIYRILKFQFASSPIYGQLLELFHEVTYQTSAGQLLDLVTAPPGSTDLSRFNMETYMRIVTYKTAFYTFYLPVACGLLLAGVTDSAAFALAKDLCIEMGRYFQIQDDYLDCFADPEVLGKIGTDIQDNKCSWLVCTALQTATEEQRKVIMDNYGQHDAAKVAVIKVLYNEMKLEQHFLDYEQSSYERLSAMIAEQKLLPPQVFSRLLAKIYKRKK